MTRMPLNVVRHCTGERFGHLTVLRFAGMLRDGRCTAAAWLCRCDCGNESVVRGKNLRNGGTTSCGCSRGQDARRLKCELSERTPEDCEDYSPERLRALLADRPAALRQPAGFWRNAVEALLGDQLVDPNRSSQFRMPATPLGRIERVGAELAGLRAVGLITHAQQRKLLKLFLEGPDAETSRRAGQPRPKRKSARRSRSR